MRTSHPRLLVLSAVLVATFSTFLPRAARAEEIDVQFGAKKQLVIGELAGLRLSPAGTSFAGPLGISFGSVSQDIFGSTGTLKTSYTTFWFAPSADIFVIDRLSVGGFIEVSSTSSSYETPQAGTSTKLTIDLPSTTTFAALARVGYMIPFGQRWGIWPRAGIGFHSTQTIIDPAALQPSRDTFSGLYLGLDVNGLWRASEHVYFVLAPEVLVSPGGSHTARTGGVERSADASAFQFAIRTGFGVLFDL